MMIEAPKIYLSITYKERGGKTVTDLSGGLGDSVDLEEFLEYTKRALIRISRRVLQEELLKGFPKNYLTFVDGKEGKPLESVNPLGKVNYVSPRQIGEILAYAMEQLHKKSPHGTGFYKKYNMIMINDKLLVAESKKDILEYFKKNDVKSGDIIRLVNIAPYASMLEREGYRSGRSGRNERKGRLRKSRDKLKRQAGLKVRNPNGAYFLTYKDINFRYGRNHLIKFEWINGRSLGGAPFPLRGPTGQKLRTTFASGKGFYVYPSIMIRIK